MPYYNIAFSMEEMTMRSEQVARKSEKKKASKTLIIESSASTLSLSSPRSKDPQERGKPNAFRAALRNIARKVINKSGRDATEKGISPARQGSRGVFPFLELPIGLRNKIYAYTLTHLHDRRNHTPLVYAPKTLFSRFAGLLLANRQIHSEYTSVLGGPRTRIQIQHIDSRSYFHRVFPPWCLERTTPLYINIAVRPNSTRGSTTYGMDILPLLEVVSRMPQVWVTFIDAEAQEPVLGQAGKDACGPPKTNPDMSETVDDLNALFAVRPSLNEVTSTFTSQVGDAHHVAKFCSLALDFLAMKSVVIEFQPLSPLTSHPVDSGDIIVHRTEMVMSVVYDKEKGLPWMQGMEWHVSYKNEQLEAEITWASVYGSQTPTSVEEWQWALRRGFEKHVGFERTRLRWGVKLQAN
ncbi:hypothetical protein P280DRAFT_524322 [Massarina eburnea CBS 473.64]|uniref:Uncharacterized protein n=1 Tax=Massarina eburnea CBS 473.64 TaxID=1395130 RepID=A0A6A6RJF5_9PLEO|nr:hypothetical protein P280DRAFT_524322 [Massarina eburnea CBS 473.64]